MAKRAAKPNVTRETRRVDDRGERDGDRRSNVGGDSEELDDRSDKSMVVDRSGSLL